MSKKINIIFWTVWAASLLIGFIESVTYLGFVTGKLGISMNIVLAIGIFLSVLVLLLRLIKKEITPRESDKIIQTFSILVVAFYIIIKIFNRMASPNFVISRLHIQPDGLMWPALISLFPVAIIWIPRINFRKLFKIQSILFVFSFLIIAQNIYMIYKSKWQTYQLIVTQPFATYDEKMRKAIGDVFYNYSLFIDKNTPRNATLLIPPKAYPWPGSGNVGYFRYFVYPRNISSGDEFEPPSKSVLDNTDYVLLNWGETDMVESPHTHDWPKFDVKAEKIIFMNKDGSYGGEKYGNYYYKDYKGKEVWGLIKILKKTESDSSTMN